MSLSPAIRAEVGAGCAVGNSLPAVVNSAAELGSMPPACPLTGKLSCKFASSGMHTSEHTIQFALASSETGGPAFRPLVAVICTRCTACLVLTVFRDSAKAHEEANSRPQTQNFSARMVLCYRINA